MEKTGTLIFGKQAFSPKISKAFRGVEIALHSTSGNPQDPGSLWIAAVCLLDMDQVETLGGKNPLEALVFIGVSGFANYAVNVCADRVVFEDDYQRVNDLWLGYASFKPSDYFAIRPKRGYYFTASVGSWISNTLTRGI